MKQIDIAFSPCPNDTFIFHAMLHGLADTRGMSFNPFIGDIDDLNNSAIEGRYCVTKLSFYAYITLKDRYTMLNSGAALGFGCGPILVAGNNGIDDLSAARVAIPGELTTANLLLGLWKPEIKNKTVVRFNEIMPGVASGRFDAGLIIHEGRFVYPEYGLKKIIDLGEWWENETGLPIPLGCIALRKNEQVLYNDINAVISSSVEYAMTNGGASRDYIRRYATEMDDDVIMSHIDLYVNDYTLDMGDTGRKAADRLEVMARCRGII
jgi:1,4-dihydroxy-6-naphthoate synthase